MPARAAMKAIDAAARAARQHATEDSVRPRARAAHARNAAAGGGCSWDVLIFLTNTRVGGQQESESGRSRRRRCIMGRMRRMSSDLGRHHTPRIGTLARMTCTFASLYAGVRSVQFFPFSFFSRFAKMELENGNRRRESEVSQDLPAISAEPPSLTHRRRSDIPRAPR